MLSQIDDYYTPTRNASNIFSIEPHETILVAEQDSGDTPSAHKNYFIYNIGRAEVHAVLKQGTKDSLKEVLETVTVQSGERKTIKVEGGPYSATGLVVHNNTDTRAIVHCTTEEEKERLV